MLIERILTRSAYQEKMLRLRMPCKSTKTHTPTVYGCSHLREMLSRWNGPLGNAVRRYSSSIWPNTPEPALIGLSANSMSSSECVRSAGFYEIGYYNTPAGTVVSGDSSCSHAGSGGTWLRIGQSSAFRAIVGRNAATTGWREDITSQAVIGLMDYKEKAITLNNSLPADLRGHEGTQWLYVLGGFGYVSGSGPLRFMREHAAELASYPESHRFGAMIRIAYQTNADGSSVCYPIVRVWERMFCGWLLAKKLNLPTSWYDVQLGSSRYRVEYELLRRWMVDIGCPDEGPPNPVYYERCQGMDISSGQDFTSGNDSVFQMLLALAAGYAVYRYASK